MFSILVLGKHLKLFNRNLLRKINFKQFTSFNLTNLPSRQFIAIQGPDSFDYIQRLITNDIRDLVEKKQNCVYSFILNNTGRIIGDLFVHKFFNKNDEFLIEFDESLMPNLYQWIKRFKIRRKLKIINETSKWQCYTLFPDVAEYIKEIPLNINDDENEILLYNDPRNYHFGYRMISKQLFTCESFANLLHKHEQYLPFFNEYKLNTSIELHYRNFRYLYGIGEGGFDIPIESSFPFQANGDLLNAVSLKKGCYVGQELTARTYHMGITRKRLMPINIIADDNNIEPLPVQNITNEQGKIAGRFRVNNGQHGLALLNLDHSNDRLQLSLSNLSVKAWIPFWWPKIS